MNLFSRLFQNVAANTQQQNISAEFDGETTVEVKFSVADIRTFKPTSEVTVGDVIQSAAALGNVTLAQSYTVLENGRPVELTNKYTNNARYSIAVNAGTAG